MFRKIFSNIQNFIKEQSNGFITLLSIYFLGAVLGAIAFAVITTEKQVELAEYFLGFIELFKTDSGVIASSVFYDIWNNIILIIGIWILGAAIVGIPFIFLIFVARGFISAFTATFLIFSAGGTGVFVSMLWLFISELLIVPLLIFIGSSAISFSLDILYRIRRKGNRQDYMISIKKKIIKYCLSIVIGGCLIIMVTIFNSWLLSVVLQTIL